MRKVEPRPVTRWISPAEPWPFKYSVIPGKRGIVCNVPIERVRINVERVKVRR